MQTRNKYKVKKVVPKGYRERERCCGRYQSASWPEDMQWVLFKARAIGKLADSRSKPAKRGAGKRFPGEFFVDALDSKPERLKNREILRKRGKRRSPFYEKGYLGAGLGFFRKSAVFAGVRGKIDSAVGRREGG